MNRNEERDSRSSREMKIEKNKQFKELPDTRYQIPDTEYFTTKTEDYGPKVMDS
jgi:hypothetical protein